MDHMVFAPKYRGKMLVGDVAMICEGIILRVMVKSDINETYAEQYIILKDPEQIRNFIGSL